MQRDRQASRQADRQRIERDRDRHTGMQADRHKNKEKDRHTHTDGCGPLAVYKSQPGKNMCKILATIEITVVT